jgi:hypothetical protein
MDLHISLHTKHHYRRALCVPWPIVMRLQSSIQWPSNALAGQNRVHVNNPRLVNRYDMQLVQLALSLRALQCVAKSRWRRRWLSPPMILTLILILMLVLVTINSETRPFATECHAHSPAGRRKKGSHVRATVGSHAAMDLGAPGGRVKACQAHMANKDAAVVRETAPD